MRHVWPRLIAVQRAAIEAIMQFAKAISAMRYAYEDRWSRRDERLHIAHGHLKRCNRSAARLQLPEGLLFCAAQDARRKYGDMGVGVGVCRMQITPHFLDEDASRTANIRHGRIQKANHEAFIIAAPPR
jgi:hypothetical protein